MFNLTKLLEYFSVITETVANDEKANTNIVHRITKKGKVKLRSRIDQKLEVFLSVKQFVRELYEQLNKIQKGEDDVDTSPQKCVELLKCIFSGKAILEAQHEVIGGKKDGLVINALNYVEEEVCKTIHKEFSSLYSMVRKYYDDRLFSEQHAGVTDKFQIKTAEKITQQFKALSEQLYLEKIKADGEKLQSCQVKGAALIGKLRTHQNWPFLNDFTFKLLQQNDIPVFTQKQYSKFQEKGFCDIEQAYQALIMMTRLSVGHQFWNDDLEGELKRMEVLLKLFEELISGRLSQSSEEIPSSPAGRSVTAPPRYFVLPGNGDNKDDDEMGLFLPKSKSEGDLPEAPVSLFRGP